MLHLQYAASICSHASLLATYLVLFVLEYISCLSGNIVFLFNEELHGHG
jgi:hypothetical protein